MKEHDRVREGMRRVDLKYAELASSQVARDINRDIVLELIRAHQPISRAEISRQSGLQRSTVSLIIEQLIEEKWVTEGAVAHRPRGRRPTLLGLNDGLAVVAVDIHPRQSTVAAVDLQGRLLSRSVIPITSQPSASIGLLIENIAAMRERISQKTFGGVGVSMPGRVDPRTQQVLFAPNLHWPDFDIKKAIESATGLPTRLENAANACMLAELWYGHMDGVRDAVLITVSEGIGTGIFANGQLVSGQSGMAGEFGHIPLDWNGPLCRCGTKGCWEVFASCAAALRYYAESTPKGKGITYQVLLNLAEEGDRDAKAALARQAKNLGRGLRMILAALSPQVILVAGAVTSAWHRFGPLIEAEMAHLALAGPPPRLLPTHEGDIARLRGAAALVFQRWSIREPTHGGASRLR